MKTCLVYQQCEKNLLYFKKIKSLISAYLSTCRIFIHRLEVNSTLHQYP